MGVLLALNYLILLSLTGPPVSENYKLTTYTFLYESYKLSDSLLISLVKSNWIVLLGTDLTGCDNLRYA